MSEMLYGGLNFLWTFVQPLQGTFYCIFVNKSPGVDFCSDQMFFQKKRFFRIFDQNSGNFQKLFNFLIV